MGPILVADDSRTTRHYLQEILEGRGYQVVTAKDGAEALELARKTRPTLILTDIVMPRMDGYELVANIRADPEIARTRVIFLTSVYHEPVARALAQECGVIDIIAKTNERAIILGAVDRALRSPETAVPAAPAPEFADEHRKLLADKLAEKIVELENEIAERQRAQQMIVELNAALQRRAEELEQRVAQRTAELERAKQAAEEANKLKSVFLATMSHELRTPLNSILGFTGILLQGLAGPLNEEQTKQLRFVQNAGRHLLALINDILDISKIEAGQIEITYLPFDLGTSIRNVIESIKPQLSQKGLSVFTEIDPGIGLVVSDRRRFEQVLLNLLNNAVKFTDQGDIRVVAKRTTIAGPPAPRTVGDQVNPDDMMASSGRSDVYPAVEVSVIDTGIGIAPENLPKLFQPFSQLATDMRKRPEGTGLGLAISKRLVEKLGGTISVESKPGSGSKFTFTIPIEPRKI